MSKNQRFQQRNEVASIIERLPDAPPAQIKPVPEHERCPCCFTGLGGVGQQRNPRYVKGNVVHYHFWCNQCGHDWTATVKIEVLEITGRPEEQLSTR